jgi:hypothetical protein
MGMGRLAGESPVPPGTAAPTVSPVITYEWRGHFENEEVNALHAEGFVDFDEHFRGSCLAGCGFTSATAGLIQP